MHNLVFFGSDSYSATTLTHLISSQKFNFVLVVTDHQKTPLPVEKLAIEQNLKVAYYPSNVDEMNIFIDLLNNLSSSAKLLGLCASFDHLIPGDVIDLFGGNLYNLHPSLLPEYRNVSPVQYALALGEQVTGMTLFRISAGIDNGEIISQIKETIRPDDTITTLTPRLFVMGAELFTLAALANFETIRVESVLDNPKNIFTHRLKRESGYVEWEVLSKLLNNQRVETSSTTNALLKLRLAHNPTGNILSDLVRALSLWPTVWSLVQSTKGELRISLELIEEKAMIKIAGKPKAISYNDFNKYYLNN